MNDLTPTERSFLLAMELRQRPMSSRAIARRYEMTVSGAHRLMSRVARVAPVVNDGGLWRVLGDPKQNGGA